MEKWLGLTLKSKPSPVQPGKDRGEKELDKKRKHDQQYDATKRVRRFLPTWQIGRPWLCYDEKADNMTCTFCCDNTHQHAEVGSFTLGTSSFQLTSVKAHELTASHMREALAVKAASKPTMESTAGKMLVALNKTLADKLSLKFKTVHALAKHDRPFTDYVWLCSLTKAKA